MISFKLKILRPVVLWTIAAGLAAAALLGQGTAAGAQQATLVSEYSSRIFLIDSEISSLKENLAWLEIKIGQMRGFNKAVPKSMETSATYKKERICVLEQTRKALSEHLETLRSRFPGGDSSRAVSLFPKEDMEIAGLETVESSTGQSQVRTATPICFTSGSANISDQYTPMLKKVAAFIKSHHPWVVVDGFADTDPINTKTFPSNFELGAIRAANIVHALVKFGADPSRFKVATTGKFRFPEARPMSDKKDAERYVNVTLIPDEG